MKEEGPPGPDGKAEAPHGAIMAARRGPASPLPLPLGDLLAA